MIKARVSVGMVNYLFERFHVTVMSRLFFSSLIIEFHFCTDKIVNSLNEKCIFIRKSWLLVKVTTNDKVFIL